jgi:hypothetical protein
MIPWARARSSPAILVLLLTWAGCATEGQGTAPPLPGDPAISGDSAGVGGDDAALDSGDGGGTGNEGSPPAGTGGGTCNDLLHGVKAIFVLPPVPCKGASDCPSSECCFVGPTASTCVMQ